jgi:Putative homoserine kinase type II (protein kinase fold)
MDGVTRIAREALNHFPVTFETLEFIARSANTIFKVTDTTGKLYTLRLHSSISESLEDYWNTPDAIRSEMVWLESLSGVPDLTVPSPVRNSRGEFVTIVDDVACTLLTWVDGDQRPTVTTMKEAEAIGEMIGKLHRQSSGWTIPDGFERPAFDDSRIMQTLAKLDEHVLAGRLPADETALLQRAGLKAVAMMNTLERTTESWGMLHGDLNPGNKVFHGTEARPIDFGACGFGYCLYDLGWTMCHIHPAFRERLLHSYSRYRPLPDRHVELPEGFCIASQLDTMSFWLGLPDWTEWLPDHIRKLSDREATAYLKGETFLFGGTPYWA